MCVLQLRARRHFSLTTCLSPFPRHPPSCLQLEVLLCRALVGRAEDVGDKPCSHLAMPNPGYDSVTGTSTLCGGTRMWAVYNNAQVYTAYIVRLQLATPCHPSTNCLAVHQCGPSVSVPPPALPPPRGVAAVSSGHDHATQPGDGATAHQVPQIRASGSSAGAVGSWRSSQACSSDEHAAGALAGLGATVPSGHTGTHAVVC